MIIEGPISISILDDDSAKKRTLEIRFEEEFQALDVKEQVGAIQAYAQMLNKQFVSLKDSDSNKSGMGLVIQICEGVLPYLESEEIDLNEVIALEIDNSVSFEQSVPITAFSLN